MVIPVVGASPQDAPAPAAVKEMLGRRAGFNTAADVLCVPIVARALSMRG